MAIFTGILIFSSYLFSANALSCYNHSATLSTDQMNTIMASVLAGTYTVNMSRIESRLPDNAAIVSGCDACTRHSGRYIETVGNVNITIHKLTWQCYLKSADTDNFDNGCGPLLPSVGSTSELVCAEMTMTKRQASGVSSTCSCCSDGCNRRMDCGVVEDRQLACPARGIQIGEMPIAEKCRYLRQAFGMLNDICEAATANSAKNNH